MAVVDDHQSDRLSSPDPLNSESDYPQSTTPARRAFRINRKNTTTPAGSARNSARSQSPNSQSTAVQTRLSTYRATPRTRTIAKRSLRDGATAQSPRKQTFELEIGRDISPQRLLVTVEAGGFDFSASGLHRRLFASSTPPSQVSPSRMTTPLARSTRRVPLKGEDEVSTRIAGTPRRPRASSNASRRETPGATPTDTPRRTQTIRHRSVTPSHQEGATPMRRSTRKTKSLMSNTVKISDLASTTPDSTFDLGETPIPAVPKAISKSKSKSKPKPKPTSTRRPTRTRNTPAKESSVPDIHDDFDIDDILLSPVTTKSRPDIPSQPTPADSGASATSGEPTTTVNVVTTTIPIADTPQISRRDFKRSRSNGEDYLDTPAMKRRFTPRRPTPARLGPTNSSSNSAPTTGSFADLFLDSTPDRSVSPPAHRNDSPSLSTMPTIPEMSSIQNDEQTAVGKAHDDDGDLWLDNLSDDDETRLQSASRDAEKANGTLQPTSIVHSVETEQPTQLYTEDSTEYGTRGVSEAKAYEELASPNTELFHNEQKHEDTNQSQKNHYEHSTQQQQNNRDSVESEAHEHIRDGSKSLPSYHKSPSASPSQAHHDRNSAELSLVPGSSRLAPLRIESEAPSEPMSEAMSASSHMRHDEDFSMIFPDSLHIDTSLPLGPRNDFGDTTNLAINRTLESLRRDRENGENNQLNSYVSTPVNLETVTEEPEEESHVQDLPRLSSPLIRFGNSPLLRSATKNAAAAHNITSPMLGRTLTPRQRKPPSLSQQLLTREALKAEQTPAGKIVDKAKSLGTLLSSGARRKPRKSLQSQQPEYEDSFTQPSESLLDAMAPKPGDYNHLSQEESTTPDTVRRHDVIDLGSDDGETPSRPPKSSKATSTPAENSQTKSLDSVVTPETQRNGEIQTTSGDTRKASSPGPDQANRADIGQQPQPLSFGAPPRISISTVPTMDKNIGAIAASSSPAPSTVQPIERPLLSSAVRAGWALQTVTSEKSSPMNQNGLGSPFRGGDSSPLANRKSSNNHTLEVPAPNPPPLFGGPTRSSVPPDSLPSIPEPTSPVTYEKEDSIFKTVPATKPTTSFRRPGRVHHAASLSPSGESTAAIAPVVPVLAAEEEHIADVSWTTDPSRSVQQNTAPYRPDSQALRKENIQHVNTASNSERKGDEDDDDDLWAIEADRSLAGNSTKTHTPTAQKGANKRSLPSVENEEVDFLQLPNKKSKKNDDIQPKADSFVSPMLPQPRLASINKATTATASRQNGTRMHMQGSDASKYRGSSRFRPMIGRHRGIVSQNGSGESPEVSSKTAFFQRKLEQAHREAAAKAGQQQKQSLQMGTSSPATPAILSKDGNEQPSVLDPGRGAASGPGSGRIDLSTFFSSPLSLPFQSARKAATAVAAAASRRFYPGTTTIDMQDEADSNNDLYGDSLESTSSVLPTSSMFPSLPPRQPGTRTRNIHRYQPQSQSQPPSRVVEVSRSSSPVASEADEEPEDTFFDHSMAHTIDQSHLNDDEEEEDHEATEDEAEFDHSAVDLADAQPADGDDDNGNIQSDAAIASTDEEDDAEDQDSSQSDPQESQDEPMTPARRLAVTTPRNAHTPPQMQLSCNDISRWREETSKVMEESPKEMRPLPRPGFPHHRALSPSKSCLRSPLKGRTPGRVVEFTSSTLSPLEQQRQRLQRQRSLAVDEQNRLEEEQREAEALANFERQALEGARRERELSVVSGMSEPSPKLRRPVGIVPPVTLAPPASGFVHQPIEMDVGEDTDPNYEYEDDNDDDDDDDDEDVEPEEEEALKNQPHPDDREAMDTSSVEQGEHAHRTGRLADLFTPKQTLAERQRAATASYHYLEPQAPPSDQSSSPSVASNASSAPTIVLPRRMHLSRRTWTNDHWRHLKYLVRIRRTRLFYFNARYVRPSEQARLVGETVSGAGESMRIMQEHADAIDAFMSDVPGWDVRDVAKRVFALVKADELRQREWLNQQNHRHNDKQSQNQHQNGEGSSSWWRNWVPFI